jgi:hypothetical protein
MEYSFRPVNVGRSRTPAFYQEGQSVRDTPDHSTNALGRVDRAVILVLVILGGAGLIMLLRTDKFETRPALTLLPSSQADMSTIANIQQAIAAINYNLGVGPANDLSPVYYTPSVGG